MNEWILIINGEETRTTYLDGLEKLRNYLRHKIAIDSANGLPDLVSEDTPLDLQDKLRIVTNDLINIATEPGQEDLNFFHLKENEDHEEVTLYCSKLNDSELYLSNGSYYLHTNLFGYCHSDILYLKYKYFTKMRLGFFGNDEHRKRMPKDKDLEIDILFIYEEAYEIVKQLKKEIFLGGQYAYFSDHTDFFLNNLRSSVITLLDAPQMYQFALDYLDGFSYYYNLRRIIRPNNQAAYILFKILKEKIKDKITEHPYNELYVESCYHKGRISLLNGFIKGYIDSLKEGDSIKGLKDNKCSHELGEICLQKKYREYLNLEDEISYYNNGGTISYFALGKIYLIKGDYKKAIHYFTLSNDPVTEAFIALSYTLQDDIDNTSLSIQRVRIETLMDNESKLAYCLSSATLYYDPPQYDDEEVNTYLYHCKDILKRKIKDNRLKKIFANKFYEIARRYDETHHDQMTAYFLAICYHHGYGIRRNLRSAFYILHELFDMGTNNLNILGEFYTVCTDILRNETETGPLIDLLAEIEQRIDQIAEFQG